IDRAGADVIEQLGGLPLRGGNFNEYELAGLLGWVRNHIKRTVSRSEVETVLAGVPDSDTNFIISRLFRNPEARELFPDTKFKLKLSGLSLSLSQYQGLLTLWQRSSRMFIHDDIKEQTGLDIEELDLRIQQGEIAEVIMAARKELEKIYAVVREEAAAGRAECVKKISKEQADTHTQRKKKIESGMSMPMWLSGETGAAERAARDSNSEIWEQSSFEEKAEIVTGDCIIKFKERGFYPNNNELDKEKTQFLQRWFKGSMFSFLVYAGFLDPANGTYDLNLKLNPWSVIRLPRGFLTERSNRVLAYMWLALKDDAAILKDAQSLIFRPSVYTNNMLGGLYNWYKDAVRVDKDKFAEIVGKDKQEEIAVMFFVNPDEKFLKPVNDIMKKLAESSLPEQAKSEFINLLRASFRETVKKDILDETGLSLDVLEKDIKAGNTEGVIAVILTAQGILHSGLDAALENKRAAVIKHLEALKISSARQPKKLQYHVKKTGTDVLGSIIVPETWKSLSFDDRTTVLADEISKRVVSEGVSPVINDFDESSRTFMIRWFGGSIFRFMLFAGFMEKSSYLFHETVTYEPWKVIRVLPQGFWAARQFRVLGYIWLVTVLGEDALKDEEGLPFSQKYFIQHLLGGLYGYYYEQPFTMEREKVTHIFGESFDLTVLFENPGNEVLVPLRTMGKKLDAADLDPEVRARFLEYWKSVRKEFLKQDITEETGLNPDEIETLIKQGKVQVVLEHMAAVLLAHRKAVLDYFANERRRIQNEITKKMERKALISGGEDLPMKMGDEEGMAQDLTLDSVDESIINLFRGRAREGLIPLSLSEAGNLLGLQAIKLGKRLRKINQILHSQGQEEILYGHEARNAFKFALIARTYQEYIADNNGAIPTPEKLSELINGKNTGFIVSAHDLQYYYLPQMKEEYPTNAMVFVRRKAVHKYGSVIDVMKGFENFIELQSQGSGKVTPSSLHGHSYRLLGLLRKHRLIPSVIQLVRAGWTKGRLERDFAYGDDLVRTRIGELYDYISLRLREGQPIDKDTIIQFDADLFKIMDRPLIEGVLRYGTREMGRKRFNDLDREYGQVSRVALVKAGLLYYYQLRLAKANLERSWIDQLIRDGDIINFEKIEGTNSHHEIVSGWFTPEEIKDEFERRSAVLKTRDIPVTTDTILLARIDAEPGLFEKEMAQLAEMLNRRDVELMAGELIRNMEKNERVRNILGALKQKHERLTRTLERGGLDNRNAQKIANRLIGVASAIDLAVLEDEAIVSAIARKVKSVLIQSPAADDSDIHAVGKAAGKKSDQKLKSRAIDDEITRMHQEREEQGLMPPTEAEIGEKLDLVPTAIAARLKKINAVRVSRGEPPLRSSKDDSQDFKLRIIIETYKEWLSLYTVPPTAQELAEMINNKQKGFTVSHWDLNAYYLKKIKEKYPVEAPYFMRETSLSHRELFAIAREFEQKNGYPITEAEAAKEMNTRSYVIRKNAGLINEALRVIGQAEITVLKRRVAQAGEPAKWSEGAERRKIGDRYAYLTNVIMDFEEFVEAKQRNRAWIKHYALNKFNFTLGEELKRRRLIPSLIELVQLGWDQKRIDQILEFGDEEIKKSVMVLCGIIRGLIAEEKEISEENLKEADPESYITANVDLFAGLIKLEIKKMTDDDFYRLDEIHEQTGVMKLKELGLTTYYMLRNDRDTAERILIQRIFRGEKELNPKPGDAGYRGEKRIYSIIKRWLDPAKVRIEYSRRAEILHSHAVPVNSETILLVKINAGEGAFEKAVQEYVSFQGKTARSIAETVWKRIEEIPYRGGPLPEYLSDRRKPLFEGLVSGGINKELAPMFVNRLLFNASRMDLVFFNDKAIALAMGSVILEYLTQQNKKVNLAAQPVWLEEETELERIVGGLPEDYWYYASPEEMMIIISAAVIEHVRLRGMYPNLDDMKKEHANFIKINFAGSLIPVLTYAGFTTRDSRLYDGRIIHQPWLVFKTVPKIFGWIHGYNRARADLWLILQLEREIRKTGNLQLMGKHFSDNRLNGLHYWYTEQIKSRNKLLESLIAEDLIREADGDPAVLNSRVASGELEEVMRDVREKIEILQDKVKRALEEEKSKAAEKVMLVSRSGYTPKGKPKDEGLRVYLERLDAESKREQSIRDSIALYTGIMEKTTLILDLEAASIHASALFACSNENIRRLEHERDLAAREVVSG
ncbi:MAG: hypothetical protein PHE58_03250, partial [Candidatus Omnitrophica bacterium]|nr:hypothetical protein [Candidatus Omnitrophota bacterium]